MILHIYRNLSVVDQFRIDERTLFIQKFLGENYIHAEVTVREPLDITIGDHVRYNGIKYYVNTIPDVTKNATNQYVYTINFESEYYDFAKVQYRFDDQGDFYLMGDLELFVDLLVTNMNRIYSGWTKGTCTQTNQEYKLMRFETENCRAAIQRLCTEFNGEFSFSRKVISFSDERTRDTGLTFEYKAGLRNIQRKPIESGNIITRLYAFGSTKNLGSSYGKLRLELKTVAPLPVDLDYIESNVATYGTIEGAVIFDDIFPRRTGTVSSIGNNVVFADAAIPFNVNTYLIPGVTAKVNFLTGNCAGYTFDIASFDNGNKLFEIIPVQLEDGSELPNNTLKPAATDTYVIIDITMPASYILAAEAELQALAIDYLAKYDHPRVTYQLNPDWRYMKSHNVNLTIGDTITIEDTDLGVNVKVRLTELTQQLISPYKYTLSMTDQVEYINSNPSTQILLKTYETGRDSANKIVSSPIRDIGVSRRNWRTTEELRSMVFDTDDYMYTEKIKPLSIETLHLTAGAKSMDYQLSGVVIKPNYLGNNTRLSITGGALIHFAIDSAGGDNIATWTLVANTTYEAVNSLPVGTAYYVYAKCNKTNYTAGDNQLILSSTAYKADQTTHWYFLVGILHSTTGSVPRGLSLTYGQTLINGGFITTGKIQSANGQTYFDLDGNTLVIGSASGYANISDKPTLGALAALDIVELAKLGETVIVGGYVKTGLVSADNINVGTLTGRVVRTAASGQRAILDSADNTLKFYIGADAGTKVVEINAGYNGYITVGDQTEKNISYIRDGVIGLCHDTATTVVLYTKYWDGTAWDTTTIFDNVGNLNLIHGMYTTGGNILCRDVNSFGAFKVTNVKVVGAQGATVADATDAATTMARLNELLARCRAHGLIATA